MSKLDKDAVIAKFTEAYQKANGKAPEIEAKGGWYSVDGGKNIRLAQLDEMADSFGADSAPAKAEKPAKKAEAPKAKKETVAKKPAAKPKAKKAAKASSGFSVKDFYTQQIKEANPGAKAPR
jgi:cell division septation protein DedD